MPAPAGSKLGTDPEPEPLLVGMSLVQTVELRVVALQVEEWPVGEWPEGELPEEE